MNNQYERIVSYVYRYDKGQKGMNVGFARIERRGQRSRITVQLRASLAQKIHEGYLFWQQPEGIRTIPMGRLVLRGGNLVLKVDTDTERLFGTELGLGQIEGIFIDVEKDVYYATTWKNDSFHLGDWKEWQAGGMKVPVAGTGGMAAGQGQDNNIAEAGEGQGEDGAGGQAEEINGAAVGSQGVSGNVDEREQKTVGDMEPTRLQTASEASANERQAAPGASANGQQAASGAGVNGQQTASGASVNGGQAAFGVSVNGQQTAFGASVNGGQAAFGVSVNGQQAVSGASVNGGQAAFGVSVNGRQAVSGASVDGRQVAMGTAVGIEHRKMAADMSAEEQVAAGGMVTKEQQPASGAEDGNEVKKGVQETEGFAQGRVVKHQKIADDGLAAESISSPEDKVQDGDKMAERTKEESDMQIQSICSTCPFKRKNYDYGKKILMTFPSMKPFPAGIARACVRMELQDIGCLPVASWQLAGNRFLLHGYYCYRHLLFAQLQDGSYVLGVPGVFSDKERRNAVRFGFDTFQAIGEPVATQGVFGYWLMDMRPVA